MRYLPTYLWWCRFSCEVTKHVYMDKEQRLHSMYNHGLFGADIDQSFFYCKDECATTWMESAINPTLRDDSM